MLVGGGGFVGAAGRHVVQTSLLRPALPPSLAPGFLPDANFGPAPSPALDAPYDVWGAITVPTQAPSLPRNPGDAYSPGDPALGLYLSFLRAFLQTDGNAIALWTAVGMAPSYPAVNQIRAHNPSDTEADSLGMGFNTKDLPALYMWRESSKHETIAEDWLMDESVAKILWVFPTAAQPQQRVRAPFASAMAKLVASAIERGRTPSWRIAGDGDPLTPTQGSFVHFFANIYSLVAVGWRPTKVVVDPVEGGKPASFPAVELTYELKENQQRDIGFYTFPAALSQSVANGNAILPYWAPFTPYAAGALIVAGPAQAPSGFIYRAAVSGAGTTGPNAPSWPTQTGATAVDAYVTWTCVGPVPAPPPPLTATA